MEEAEGSLIEEVPRNYGLWDYESAKIRGATRNVADYIDHVLTGIIQLLVEEHISGSFTLEVVVGKYTEDRIPDFRKEQLEKRGVRFTSMNSGVPGAADDEILKRMEKWFQQCNEGLLLLIASDKGYGDMCHFLRTRETIRTMLIYNPTQLGGGINAYPIDGRFTWGSIFDRYGDPELSNVGRIDGRPVVPAVESIFWSRDSVLVAHRRAVNQFPYSVENWLNYCAFARYTYGDSPTIRRLFDDALKYVGTDFLSSPLWDEYIAYESMQKDWSRLANIYTNLLKYPIRGLPNYFLCLKALVGQQPQLKRWSGAALTTYLGLIEAMFDKSNDLLNKIIGFERVIENSSSSLTVSELKNWHDYLDLIEKERDNDKVVKLYERCLIHCANQPEYWTRYVLKIKEIRDKDNADSVLARAIRVCAKKQLEIQFLAVARLKEHKGDIAGARFAYKLVHSEISPGLLEAVIKHANMERRLNHLDEAFHVYEEVITLEKRKEHSTILLLLYASYAEFTYLLSGNVEKARKIIFDALENVQPSIPLMLFLIHFETTQPRASRRFDYLEPCVEKLIKPDADNIASSTEREELSLIYVEFLGICGDVISLKKAEDQHATLFLSRQSISKMKKKA